MTNLRAPTTDTAGFVESVLDALSKPLPVDDEADEDRAIADYLASIDKPRGGRR